MSAPPADRSHQTMHCEGQWQFERISLDKEHTLGACTTILIDSAPWWPSIMCGKCTLLLKVAMGERQGGQHSPQTSPGCAPSGPSVMSRLPKASEAAG